MIRILLVAVALAACGESVGAPIVGPLNGVLYQSGAPNASGGRPAPVGQLLVDISTGNLWVKTGVAAATWTLQTSGGGSPSGYGLNARTYGAIGDGVTDDTTALRAALAAAAATVGGRFGQFVFLPKGTYLVSGKLSLANGVGILGEGPSASMIKAAATFSDTAVVINSDQSGGQEFAFLQGLKIDANSAGGAVQSVAAVDLTSLFVNSFVRDVVIANSSSVGLHVGASNAAGPFFVENTWVTSSGTDNVVLEEMAGNTGAVNGFVTFGLTSEHQATGFAAVRLKGLGHAQGWELYNTHIEMANTGAGTTGITIDGVAHVILSGVQLLAGAAGSIHGIEITNNASNVDIQIRGVTNANLINPALEDLKSGVTMGVGAIPIYTTTDVGDTTSREQTLAYGVSVATDLTKGNICILNATDGNAFTIANPTNAQTGQRLTYQIVNSSGGALGAITWGTDFAYMDGTFVSPGNGNRRTISFVRRSAGNWIQDGLPSSDMNSTGGFIVSALQSNSTAILRGDSVNQRPVSLQKNDGSQVYGFQYSGTSMQFRNITGASTMWQADTDGTITIPNASLKLGGGPTTLKCVGAPSANHGSVGTGSSNCVGNITTIGSFTSVTLTFSAAFASRSWCFAEANSTSVALENIVVTNSASAPVFSCFNALTGVAANCDDFSYWCVGQ